MRAIDFFCGGGGMTRGLLNAGIEVLAGVDICPEYEETYTINNHNLYLARSITDITEEEILEIIPDIHNADDVLFVGCAPCQPFSKQRNVPEEHRDRSLLLEFGNVVEQYHPAYVVVENVPDITKRGQDIFNQFLNTLTANGYHYAYAVLNAKKYGVPQNRNRLVLIASHLTEAFLPPPLHDGINVPYVTVAQAIGHYPAIEAGEVDHNVPNHAATSLSALNLQRIQATAHDGGLRVDWPEHLVLNCHNGRAGHTDVYGRMAWNSTAPTLTSKCCSLSNGRFGHPEQDRAISFREAAALQSFPDDYIFYGNSNAVIARQIGNAVPVLLAQAIGDTLLQMERNWLEEQGIL